MSRTSPLSVAHETLLFERRLRASPEAVFAAYADVTLRARWSAPAPSVAVVYAADDFVSPVSFGTSIFWRDGASSTAR